MSGPQVLPRHPAAQSVRAPGRLRHSRRLVSIAGCLLVAGLGAIAPSADAGTTTMVNLGTASTYAALSGASIGNTVSAVGDPHTTLHGNLGIVANTQPTGFPPGVVTGTRNVGNAAAAQAGTDLQAAYSEIGGRTGATPLAGALVGTTIAPGLYAVAGAVSNTGTVTLDAGGDPNAVFVFQVNGALTTAASSHVVLAGGALASRVFWQVNGAASIGATATFAGTLIAHDAVDIGHASVFNGRALALTGALTLDDNDVYSAPPVVTIAGGASAITTDTTPTISGTTDVTSAMSVTITGPAPTQTLSPTPSSGAWSVTSAILPNGTYTVVSSVTDGAGNPGTATQQLTIDTVPPVVTLDGGTPVTTNDPTPTIAGTSDAAPATVIRVSIDSRSLTALVQSDGTWNVTPAILGDGAHAVTAAVTDPAGNVGTASQTLIVDTTAPALTIGGGASALTDDATPEISGTAAVAAGTTVTVSLADETLSGVVQGDGTWSVTASALSDGPHRVITSVSDSAGNPASSTQTLTVDTVAPGVAIIGGPRASTSDLDPTITGTSDAAPGTTITVSIAGQTLTTLLQANGTWNATPTRVGEGTWTVVAAAPDPAGNIGAAMQTLTIAAATTPGTTGTPGPTGGAAPPAAPGLPTPPSLTPAPDRRGPLDAAALTVVTPSGRQKLSGSSLTIGTTATAPAGGRVTATARGTLKIGGIAKAITLTRVTRAVAAGRSATLKLTPIGTKAARGHARALVAAATRTHRAVTAAITITVVDVAGNRHVFTRTVKLT